MRALTFRCVAVLLSGVTLAACGNTPSRSPLATMTGQVAGALRPAPDVADARAVLTPALVAASATSVLLVIQRTSDTAFTMVPVAANLDTVQWRNASDTGLLRRDGVVVGTRGLGFDLLTADAPGLAAAFAAGGARDVRRVNRHLAGEGGIVARAWSCDVRLLGAERLEYYGRSFETRVFEEVCRAGDDGFTNRYWVEGDGTVRRSVERISPEVGDLEIVRLTE